MTVLPVKGTLLYDVCLARSYGGCRLTSHAAKFAWFLVALAAAFGLYWFPGEVLRASDGAYIVPGRTAMTPEAAVANGDRLAPALLLGVYDAFSRTDEAAIYDTLAEVSAGDALEALYLERLGAMVGGGLTGADQTIHEMQMLDLATDRSGKTLRMDARWQVIGTVGHSDHQHVRGNAYSADLVIEPVDGAWRITGFVLRDVDRSLAGTTAEEQTSWW